MMARLTAKRSSGVVPEVDRRIFTCRQQSMQAGEYTVDVTSQKSKTRVSVAHKKGLMSPNNFLK